MSEKDEAIGRLVRLLDHCDTASVVRLADEVEDSAEIGVYGVCYLPEEEPRWVHRRTALAAAACESPSRWL
jgi:hypothetical protein